MKWLALFKPVCVREEHVAVLKWFEESCEQQVGEATSSSLFSSLLPFPPLTSLQGCENRVP